ncbi:peptide methionine sulfoxide reductase MsrB [Senna tora]|uniref:Peptide methionine sulfoxide reductase MsrB n=1 Tax=Senna tora TaxID=362788 RepID=A0A834TYH7_9FABA|nr:peptide methionine sulfoxide reductase MsrB [Senna tora]
MGCIYTCTDCGTNLNLNPDSLYPPDFYFDAGNKGTISFSMIDQTKFKFEQEDKVRPFFETLSYWGLHRKRIKILCNTCSRLIGHVYDDGPPLTNNPGQYHMGPTQVIPRASRFRFKTKALRIVSDSDSQTC